MQFLITAYDHTDEDAPARRMSVRPAHLENLKHVMETARIICAGGIKDDNGRPVGSYLVMDFETREMLDEYLAGEPYITGGVWKDIKAAPCAVVIKDNKTAGI